MGALPKQRISQARQGKGRAHLFLTAPQLMKCSNCDQPKLSHRVCPNCGYYKDQPVVEIKQRKARPQG